MVQIKRGTDLENCYHVKTEENPCDLGTRPSKVTLEDVAPNGPWQKGLDWMRNNVEDAVEKGVLTPVSELRLSKDEEEDFDKGFFHELSPEILTRGH